MAKNSWKKAFRIVFWVSSLLQNKKMVCVSLDKVEASGIDLKMPKISRQLVVLPLDWQASAWWKKYVFLEVS
ncbi:MAG: hypothetical protein IPL31_03990 [Saprospiraceae bacterium]|nr:hypothetical protein [Saprospiraceae bacterium]